MGNFFQSGLWCLGEPQNAEKKNYATELMAGWTKYGPITMEEPELGFQIG
jgi:hypothetical protein